MVVELAAPAGRSARCVETAVAARVSWSTKVSLRWTAGPSTNGYRSSIPMLRLTALSASVSGIHASSSSLRSPCWASGGSDWSGSAEATPAAGPETRTPHAAAVCSASLTCR